MNEAEAVEVSTDIKSETPRPRLLRSIGAILAGFLAIVLLSTATDMALVFPCAHCDLIAVCVGGRQTPSHPTTR